MDTRQIILTSLKLAASGLDTETIIAAVLAMADVDQTAPQTAPQAATTTNGNGRGNPALMPMKAYRIVRRANESNGQIAQRIAAMNLPEQENHIAALLISDGPQRRTDVTERLRHATKKVTESLLYKMRTRGIVESFELDEQTHNMETRDALTALAQQAQTRKRKAPQPKKRATGHTGKLR